MEHTAFAGIGYSQHLNTCVLASYGVACFPFTGTRVLQYFGAYCRHFNRIENPCPNLDEAHPERSYEGHFHDLARRPGNSGYGILRDLHDGSGEPEFVAARNAVTLEPVDWGRMDAGAVDLELRQADCVLLLFVNASPFPGLSMHSIVVARDGSGLYYFDTGLGAAVLYRHRVGAINDFGTLGDAYLVRRRH
jgi:hypothetical protein